MCAYGLGNVDYYLGMRQQRSGFDSKDLEGKSGLPTCNSSTSATFAVFDRHVSNVARRMHLSWQLVAASSMRRLASRCQDTSFISPTEDPR